MDIYPGTEILGLPVAVVTVWRVTLWLLTVVVLARMAANANRRSQSSASWTIGRTALVFFLVSDFILNAERLGQPATWEGLPLTTFGVVLAGWAAFTHPVIRGDESGVQ